MFIEKNESVLNDIFEYINDNGSKINKIMVTPMLHDELKRFGLLKRVGRIYLFKNIRIDKEYSLKYNRFYYIYSEKKFDCADITIKNNGVFNVNYELGD